MMAAADMDEPYLGAAAYGALFAPAVERVEARLPAPVAHQLKNALAAFDRAAPGALLQVAGSLASHAQLPADLQESVLRLQASAGGGDDESCAAALRARGPPHATLAERAAGLRAVLARVPDEIADRRAFLETIKEIASSIKKLLDATNAVHAACGSTSSQQGLAAMERRKKEFVHYSKRFSNTLKEYFKGEPTHSVFAAANQLAFHTVLIVRTAAHKLA